MATPYPAPYVGHYLYSELQQSTYLQSLESILLGHSVSKEEKERRRLINCVLTCNINRDSFSTTKTFKAAATWIDKLRKNEALHDYLADHSIKWGFTLAKSPWHSGFYERMIRDLKTMTWQKLGKGHFSFEGFTRVIKDIEIIFNNRPLQYVEDELGPRVLTPNRIIHGRDIHLLEEIEEPDSPSEMEKRIRKAKKVMWHRRTTEYIRRMLQRESHIIQKLGKSCWL